MLNSLVALSLSAAVLVSANPFEATFAQNASLCGQPPRIDDEEIKGQLDGKAKFLSSFLGDAQLSGQVDIARKDVFSKVPEGLKARSIAYLQYQVCVILFADQKLTTPQKIDELLRVQASFGKQDH